MEIIVNVIIYSTIDDTTHYILTLCTWSKCIELYIRLETSDKFISYIGNGCYNKPMFSYFNSYHDND